MHPFLWFLVLIGGLAAMGLIGGLILSWADGRDERRKSEHKKAVLYRKTLLEIEDMVQNLISINGHARMEDDFILEKIRKVVRSIE